MLASLWQCDFVTKRIWTLKGKVEAFVLFFIHVESRKVWCSPASVQPNPVWVAQQARNVSMWAADEGLARRHVVRDRDGKFHGNFGDVFAAQGVEVEVLPVRSPNLNAFAERWVQSARIECLDHFVVVGESHLDHIMSEYVAHYNSERPHQGKGNEPLIALPPPTPGGKIECKRRLGGLLKHYTRRAA